MGSKRLPLKRLRDQGLIILKRRWFQGNLETACACSVVIKEMEPDSSPLNVENTIQWAFAETRGSDWKRTKREKREKIRKAKAHLELNLATEVKNNRKLFTNALRGEQRTISTLYWMPQGM